MGERTTGGDFYDPVVTADYLAHRHAGVRSPNTVMEEPALLDAIGDIGGARVLDLGCGDGRFALTALELGARSYHGIDASPSMIEVARGTVTDRRATFDCRAIEQLEADTPAYDVVTSRMALHYVADLGDALRRVHRVVRQGGRFVFSVVHPVMSCTDDARPGPRTDWTVDSYFEEGPRERLWFGRKVTWYHRTVEQHVRAVTQAGFRLDGLCECEPDAGLLAEHPDELRRRRRVPLILLLATTRTDSPGSQHLGSSVTPCGAEGG